MCNAVDVLAVRADKRLWLQSPSDSIAKRIADNDDAEMTQLWTKWVDEFRDVIRKATASSLSPRLMISYDRRTLGQTGTGHISVKKTKIQ